MTSDATAELIALDARRCAAIAADDHETLRALLSPRLVHVHTRGNRDTRDSYLEYLRTIVDIQEVRRVDLEAQVFGDCAVMTGVQVNVARPRKDPDAPTIEVTSRAMQVWARDEGRWTQVAFQATPIGPPPPPVPR